eukprot:SAG22_NODE_4_length_44774_cov_362.122149_46_plen_431_part_00
MTTTFSWVVIPFCALCCVCVFFGWCMDTCEDKKNKKIAAERVRYEEENAIELHLKKFGLDQFAAKIKGQGLDTLAALAELDTHEIAFLITNVGIVSTKDTSQMYHAMAELGNQAADGSSIEQQRRAREEVKKWLAEAKLGQFAEKLFAQGAESMAILRKLDAESVTVLIEQVGMGVGHTKTFRAALVKLGNENAYARKEQKGDLEKALLAGNTGRSDQKQGIAIRRAKRSQEPVKVVVYPQPVPYNVRYTVVFPLQELFPQVILSYCTYTDNGLGKEHVWAVANILNDAGISSFHGYMVEAGQDWEKKWFGKMPRAKVGVVMLSEAFFKSGPCKEELLALIKKGHPIIPVVFDMSAHKAMKGDTFLGTDPDSIEDANFLKTKMTGNSLPPPDQGVFQTNFDRNAAELVRLVKRELAFAGGAGSAVGATHG